MKWVMTVMFIIWVMVVAGGLADRQWSTDGNGVTVVKMGAQP